MAKITDLPLADIFDGSEDFPLVQGGGTKRASVQRLLPGSFETTEPACVVYLDVDGHVIAQVPDPATKANTSAIALKAGGSFYETTDQSLTSLTLDAGGRIVFNAAAPSPTDLSEVTNARGSRTTLDGRLSQALNPFGDPVGPTWGTWLLRNTRMILRQRALGESAQLVMGLMGDSYTQTGERYPTPLAKLLQTEFGSAGVGYVSLCWAGTASPPFTGTVPSPDASVRPDLVPNPLINGTWTCNYHVNGHSGPNISNIVSSTAGDWVRMNVPAGHQGAVLHYDGDGTGVVKYSWDNGATWSGNVALATVGADHVVLTGVPATDASLRLQVVSGNVGLCGVDLQSTSPGVRIHKLGAGGSTAANWAAANAAQWQAGLQALGLNFASMMLGTNDQGAAVSTATFAAQMATIAARVKAALPYADFMIAAPAENQRPNNAIAMPLYTRAQREMAIGAGYAFLDMQFYFGSPANKAAEYGNANSARPWYQSDLIHPEPTLGGRVQADAFYRLLKYS